jgi:glycosyltransferase involved in cell wall biosynthesis
MMARSFSILHVLAPARVGGLEAVVRALSREQLRRGHRVVVFPVLHEEPGEHPFLRALKEEGVPVVEERVPVRGYRLERALVRRQLDSMAPDILHTHGYRPDLLDAPVARKLGIATVSTAHGITGTGFRVKTYEWFQTRALRGFDAVIAVSRDLGLRLVKCGVPSDRLHVIPNAWAPAGPPLDRMAARGVLGIPGSGPVVGWVGRFTPEKGADVMLRAMAVESSREATLSLIGAGPQEEELRALAESMGIASRVRWHGIVEGAGRLLPAFDVFALSSRTEGTPMVLLEAMAAGVPVVTTSVGGIPDVVSEKEAALVPSEDPRALGEAIQAILTEKGRGSALASAAAQRLRTQYSIDRWLNRYEEAYMAAVR